LTLKEKDEYRTLAAESRGLYKEKGSRFIGIAIPVSSVTDVRLNLDRLRKEYHDARHHCYAYRIGKEPFEYRYQDDGEPSGTAGKPIYGQIQSFDITNILIVVIRYFGGIKLGTGGLIQAYKSSAKDAIENGSIINKVWTSLVDIRFDYHQINEVMKIIKAENLKIVSHESTEVCRIVLEIRTGSLELIKNKLSLPEKVELTVI